ncbi:hypothetical protein B0H10DRAFT_1961869 [Mycena sp. CBHHK59/15]|nr:hypothetical protein B0H10DRAFT_1961869 [Mycena sp. CBHHK59/15]
MFWALNCCSAGRFWLTRLPRTDRRLGPQKKSKLQASPSILDYPQDWATRTSSLTPLVAMRFLAHLPPILDPITTLKLMYLSLYAVPFPGLTPNRSDESSRRETHCAGACNTVTDCYHPVNDLFLRTQGGVLRQVRVSIRQEEGRYVLPTCNACLLTSFCVESPISSWDTMNGHADLLLEHPECSTSARLLRFTEGEHRASYDLAMHLWPPRSIALIMHGMKARAVHRMGASISSLGCTQDGCIRQLPRLCAGWVLPSAPEAAHRTAPEAAP